MSSTYTWAPAGFVITESVPEPLADVAAGSSGTVTPDAGNAVAIGIPMVAGLDTTGAVAGMDVVAVVAAVVDDVVAVVVTVVVTGANGTAGIVTLKPAREETTLQLKAQGLKTCCLRE
jgi:hypothetical protein